MKAHKAQVACSGNNGKGDPNNICGDMPLADPDNPQW